MHYFTSITANYIPKARVLARSVKDHDPTAVFYLVLSDKLPDSVKVDTEPFDAILCIEDLGIPEFDSWVFKHGVVELCTAVKGITFLKILESEHADKIIFFDPDIVVLHPLDELSAILDRYSVVLTPHQVVPDSTHEAIIDNEICSLKHGVYNLGFLAIRRSETGMRFIRWYSDRLREFCYDDIPNGLYADQRWADLTPAFFDNVHILRDKTYHVATWNLTHREVLSNDDDVLSVSGAPIKFFHFSGFDSGAQEIMLKKYAGMKSPLFDLRKWYIQRLKEEGQEKFGILPCIYSFYSNGEKIAVEHREIYRSRQDLIDAFPRPATVTEDKFCYYWWYKNVGQFERREKHMRRQNLLFRYESRAHQLLEITIQFFGTRLHRLLAHIIRILSHIRQ
ncbi:glycosyl transferase [Thermodesulfobacteriota bacterium]